MAKKEYIQVGETQQLATDLYRTPDTLFEELDREFNFVFDAAARREDAHCVHYLGPDKDEPSLRDALAFPHWAAPFAVGPVFVNPPYSKNGGGLGEWIERCVATGEHEIVVALVPCTPSTAWFQKAFYSATELRLFSRRVNCDKPDGTPTDSARGDLCLFVWRPGGNLPRCLVRYWEPRPEEARREAAASDPEQLPWS